MKFSRKVAENVQTDCAVQVIGFGIAGLGIALAADREHDLSSLCQQGLVYIDKRNRHTFSSLAFDILSNSPANDFISGIRRDGAFAHMFDNANGKKLCCLSDKEAPLMLVSDFFRDATEYLHDSFGNYDRSQFLADTEVATLKLEDNGDITSIDTQGRELIRSQFAVIATGSAETFKPAIVTLANHLGVPLECSEAMLRGEYDENLLKNIQAGLHIVVIGGSHSAFSVVDYILRRFDHYLHDRQIVILSRSPINVYYDSIEQFNHTAHANETHRVDFETQCINRYCGLRCDAKKLYQKIIKANESRVQLFIASEESALNELENNLGDIGLMIQAIGYSTQQPRIVNSEGDEIHYKVLNHCAALSQSHNFNAKNNQIIDQLFGIGLGCFVPTLSPYTTTGEVPVGVNVYHQKDASIIVDHIFKQLNNVDSISTMETNELELSDLC